MEFKDKLKKLRTERNITQSELAKAIYVSRCAVAKWENGRGLPNEESKKALAVYFGVAETYFEPDQQEQIDIEKAFTDDNLPKKKKIRKKLNITLSNDAQIVYNSLNEQKFTVDDLSDLSLSDDALLSSLTELEIEGLIKAVPGGAYEVINH